MVHLLNAPEGPTSLARGGSPEKHNAIEYRSPRRGRRQPFIERGHYVIC